MLAGRDELPARRIPGATGDQLYQDLWTALYINKMPVQKRNKMILLTLLLEHTNQFFLSKQRTGARQSPNTRASVNNSKVLPSSALPSEYTQQPPFLCHCDSVLSLGGGKAVEIKPSHDHSFPKELFKQGGSTWSKAYGTTSPHYQ